MEYLELHISERNFERLIFIFIILILVLVAVFIPSKKCSEQTCKQPQITGETVKAIETKTVVEEPEEQPIYYVDIQNFHFAPQELIIKKDSIVIFANKETTLVHKIYEVKGLFLGPRMEPMETFSYTFNQTGNFTLFSVMGKDKGTKMEIRVIS
ncbi:hypothetical protein CEE44_04890 [Candidatus Woesearchaeota archaeon B3_Woes]|nr:MAG: hypothetical protein CEE44_04890 [Candidatus Woesearchaeota archaeon B3_Woes]